MKAAVTKNGLKKLVAQPNKMAHQHPHNQSHPNLKGRNLLISIVLNIIITVAQAVGGIVSGSLSLLSDALHNFTDVVSLLISYIADRFSKRAASFDKTFGYKRAEIIAAFVNSASLIVVAFYLIFEAANRFLDPQVIESEIVIWLALLGIIANGFSVLLLRKNSKNNMNIRSAYLHLLTDMAASIAVLVGGILMLYFQWWWIDSVLTFAIAIYLIFMGYDLLKKSFKVLMLFTPSAIQIEEITATALQLEKVKSMHHIHIWQLNEDEIHLEAHLEFKDDLKISEFDATLQHLEALLFQKFGINHVNIQPEFNKKEKSKDIIVQD